MGGFRLAGRAVGRWSGRRRTSWAGRGMGRRDGGAGCCLGIL